MSTDIPVDIYIERAINVRKVNCMNSLTMHKTHISFHQGTNNLRFGLRMYNRF
jgi:hypothetical protein